MGLAWLWLAVSWLALVWAARAEELRGWRRNGACLVLGVAPLVRPELGLMMICLMVGWFVLARPRRIVKDLVWMFALPVVYEIFRMGYYASLVPNTALAKGAGGLHVRQGWDYAQDFISTYHLWLTAAIVLVLLGLRWMRARDSRMAVATVAMIGAAGLDAAYIVAIGGDYMHGRLLLPAFFAFGLPASICLQRSRVPELVLAGAATVWALITLVAFRPAPPAPTGYLVVQVADWRAVSGAKIVLDDSVGAAGLSGHEVADMYAKGERGYYQVLSTEALPSLDPDAFVYTLGSIGTPAYNAGRSVWIVDIGGLAEPLAARSTPKPNRPAGHRKNVDPAWYDARFGVPSPNDSDAVVAARRALGCGEVKELLDAVDGDMTAGRFFSNIWDSFSLTRMNVPADPVEAEKKFCPPP
jgi:arabinofuranosyltransferase